MASTVKDPTKISSHVTIPEGMYFIPKVHCGLLAYRTQLDIEKHESPQKAVEFVKNFVSNTKEYEKDMMLVYKKALTKFKKATQ